MLHLMHHTTSGAVLLRIVGAVRRARYLHLRQLPGWDGVSWWRHRVRSASATNACGTTAACISSTTLRTSFYGCSGGGGCDMTTPRATSDNPSACSGGENSICVGSACANLCGNAADDDGDGIVDSCDADCTGSAATECPAGACCLSSGCHASTDVQCGATAWTCASLCTRQRTLLNCSGSDAACGSGPSAVETEHCGAGSVCSAGSCVPVSVTASCSTADSCASASAINRTYHSCDGSGSCSAAAPSVTAALATCPGTENNACAAGVCTDLCANGLDDDGDGFFDACDGDCGGPQCSSGSCCDTSGGTTNGCFRDTSAVCAATGGVCIGAAPSCSRSLVQTHCPGNATSCSGTTSLSPVPCPSGTLCESGTCVAPRANLTCGASPPSGCASLTAITAVYTGCNSTGGCDVPSSRCAGGVCVDACSNGLDDDGDGFVDACDADCGGPQCTSGPCCELDVLSPLRGCYRNRTSVCGVSGASCVGSCTTLGSLTYCSGSDAACTGPVVPDQPYDCPLGTACSAGVCATVSADASCLTPEPAGCSSNGTALADAYGCDGGGSCRDTPVDRIRVGTACGGNEASWCVDSACVSACADAIDNDGDGLVDVADPDCAGVAAAPSPSDPVWAREAFLIPIAVLGCCILLLLLLLLAFCRSGGNGGDEAEAKLALDENHDPMVDRSTGVYVGYAVHSGSPARASSIASAVSPASPVSPVSAASLSISNPVYDNLSVFGHESDLSRTHWGDTTENVVYDDEAADVVVVYDPAILSSRLPVSPGAPVADRGSQLRPYRR
ncbi:uncharacterized protein AMSG_08506 [Thecamonas trahens ATCC 50062]|uniref:Uncharacterized protein n=1 Tax=Thecamonas trahens ATCC 50062 TaxID=461836 RepID=A0A0L0DMM0_THETB|nr:hypothetical protein AMSG_08506 [Thecamonas trahens ATCC 50062]KNC52638.1 hypothetical protein AMSG_08506 [Thecamonas trahens ATCC 50062]|eukprot:XP_013755190.1 hypothetical protein AMSG_08506 [Thecamonas trahens ATCC 50062]